MVKSRARLGVLAAASMALVLSACGGSSESASTASAEAPSAAPASSAAPAEETPEAPADSGEFAVEVVPGSGEGFKVGYISLGDSIPFVKLVSDDIKAQAEAAGLELLFCDSEIDAAKALECARTFNTQGVQGIINFQLDEKAAPQICEAGPDVPVVAVDIHQEPCEDTFMGADNAFAGELAGTNLGQHFQDNFSCEVDALVSLESPGAGAVNEARAGGMIDGFQSVCGELPAGKLIPVDGGQNIDGGREKFADILTSLGGAEKIAVVSLNDDMLLGAFAAATSQGREDQVFGVAQGADPSSWDAIQNNPGWIGDTAYFPERYGTIAVPAIIGLMKGQDVPAELFTEHVFINADNFAEYYG
ncbi:MAG: sugar ABC transporter substrate-binding protein [Candidatus Nanopelagicales bacterium]|nr:sugar ABC transporter substrate-binding protein [Candidatus Nanopelagicales bacterium]